MNKARRHTLRKGRFAQFRLEYLNWLGGFEGNQLASWLNTKGREQRRIERLLGLLGTVHDAPSARAVKLPLYHMRPAAFWWDGKLRFRWEGANRSGQAMMWIEYLVKLGVLENVRRCRKCSRWFFARFSHQHFDSPRCRQDHYERSPAGKEKRRLYMQRYRKLTNSGKVRIGRK